MCKKCMKNICFIFLEIKSGYTPFTGKHDSNMAGTASSVKSCGTAPGEYSLPQITLLFISWFSARCGTSLSSELVALNGSIVVSIRLALAQGVRKIVGAFVLSVGRCT